MREGRLEEAEKAFLAALAESPAHAPSSVQLGRIYSTWGRPKDARRVLEAGLERHPEGLGLLNELGWLLLGEGEAREARAVFERAIAVDPRNPRARLGLAQSIGETGDLQGALGILDEGAALGVLHPGLDVYRAMVLASFGRTAEAVSVLEKTLESNPDAPEAERQLGLLAYKLNRDAEAANYLTKALERNPKDAEARITLGKISYRRADYAGARLAFELALEASPPSEEAHFYLGEIERASQRFEEAADHYRKSGSSAGARNGLAEALLKLGRDDEAEKTLEDALATATEAKARAQTLYLVGSLRSERGDDQGAVAALAEASKSDPYHPGIRYLLGTVLARLGRGEEARRELEAFGALKSFEERKGKLELALLARPAEADSYVPLIELYLEEGRGDEALPFLEKALALAPDHPKLLELKRHIQGGEPRC
jgi:tetratricopeptide (TPR) repeat protein